MIINSVFSYFCFVLFACILMISLHDDITVAASSIPGPTSNVVPTKSSGDEDVTLLPEKERVTLKSSDLTEVSTKKPLEKKEAVRKTTTTTREPEVTTKTLYQFNGEGGTACILLRTDALVTFTYYSAMMKEEIERNIFVPENAEIGGDCSEDTARLELKWADFKLRWYFEKTPGGERWFVDKIELWFDGSSSRLEHLNHPDQKVTLSTPKSHSALLFVTPVGQAYTCLREIEVKLTNPKSDVTAALLLRDLEIQPFLFKDNNFGPEYRCPAPGQGTYRSESAPLIVGSILAAACLGTVTGYGIFRYFKIKKVQYDTME